ncbi:MAG: energy-coupling factor transporter transmembrane protein EcfT [Firmicutes bacterium]|nr:energy-coupling factor transporter transmembrane protein EcfT [Bacillota bacterium]
MNRRFMISYSPGTTPLQRLNGTTKVLGFLVITVYIIMTFDVRMLLPMFVLCTIGVISMKPNWKLVFFMFAFMFVMAGLIGSTMIILVRPSSGLTRVGAENIIWQLNDRFFISLELLWYVGMMFFKRVCSFASAILFIVAITPSELASGLNRLKVPYKICTIMALAFRTIPDIARDYGNIKNSLMMRGIEMDSKKAGLGTKLKQTIFMLAPLIMTSFGKVGNIANAMDLRGFGKHKQRTWYSEKEPTRADWVARVLIILLGLFCIYYIIQFRFVNPPAFDYWAPWVESR